MPTTSIDESVSRIQFAYANGLISNGVVVTSIAQWRAVLPEGTFSAAQSKIRWLVRNHTVNGIALPNVENVYAFIRQQKVNLREEVTLGDLADWCDELAETSLIRYGVQLAVVPHPVAIAGKLLKKKNPKAYHYCELIHDTLIKKKRERPSGPQARMLDTLVDNHALYWAGQDRSHTSGEGNYRYQADHRHGYGAGVLTHYDIPVPSNLPQPPDFRHTYPVFETALAISQDVQQDPTYRLTAAVQALESGVFHDMWIGHDGLAWQSRENKRKNQNSGYVRFIREEIAGGNRCTCALCSRGVQDIAPLEDSPMLDVDESISSSASHLKTADAAGSTAGSVSGDLNLVTGSTSTPNSGDVTIGSGASTSASGGDTALTVGSGDLLGGSVTLDAGESASASDGDASLAAGDSLSTDGANTTIPAGSSRGGFSLATSSTAASGTLTSASGGDTALTVSLSDLSGGSLANSEDASLTTAAASAQSTDDGITLSAGNRSNAFTFTQSIHNTTVQHDGDAAREIKKMHTRLNANGAIVSKQPSECTHEELQEQKEACEEATRNGRDAKLAIQCFDSHMNDDKGLMTQVLTGQLLAEETKYPPVVINVLDIVRTTKMLLSAGVSLKGIESREEIANSMKCVFSGLPIRPDEMQSTDCHHVFAGKNLVLSYKGIEYVFDTAKRMNISSFLCGTASRDGFAQLKRELAVVAITKRSAHHLYHKAEAMIESGDVTDVVLPFKIDKRRKRIIIDVLEHLLGQFD
eukprot:scaffold10695_cov137-Skeletonema_menzelii.AAC.1